MPHFRAPQEVSNVPISEAQKKASVKYLEKLDEVYSRSKSSSSWYMNFIMQVHGFVRLCFYVLYVPTWTECTKYTKYIKYTPNRIRGNSCTAEKIDLWFA